MAGLVGYRGLVLHVNEIHSHGNAIMMCATPISVGTFYNVGDVSQRILPYHVTGRNNLIGTCRGGQVLYASNQTSFLPLPE